MPGYKIESPEASHRQGEMETGKGHSRLFFFFKILLLSLCISAVVYQIILYLEIFWSYPEVIATGIESDREAVLPAVTVCDANSISREMFCKNYPSNCLKITNQDWVCLQYPDYCRGGINLKSISTMPDFLLHDIPQYMKNISRSDKFSVYEGRWTGPFYYLYRNQPLSCFTLNSLVDTDNVTNQMHLSDIEELEKEYTFNVFSQSDDRIFPWVKPGFYIHIHSPFVRVNAPSQGTFIESGRIYLIHYRMEEEHLLPFPYKSDCNNYISEWKRNNKTGPKSQSMCLEDCYKNVYCSYHGNRTFLHHIYPVSYCEEDKRNLKNIDPRESYKKKISVCRSQCKQDCVKYRYPYTAHEQPPDDFTVLLDGAKVQIVLDEPEVHVLKHVPQHQNVELFSYIGGFLGLWLGVSIYSFADVIEKIFVLLTSYCNRLRNLKDLQIFGRRGREKVEKGDPEYL